MLSDKDLRGRPRPIRSAPLDREILLTCDWDFPVQWYLGRFDPISQQWFVGDDGDYADMQAGMESDWFIPATHWADLPELPKLSKRARLN